MFCWPVNERLEKLVCDLLLLLVTLFRKRVPKHLLLSQTALTCNLFSLRTLQNIQQRLQGYLHLYDMKRQVQISFVYPWCTPVELRKDAPTQGIYSLQHFRSELWKLRGLTDRLRKMITIKKERD